MLFLVGETEYAVIPTEHEEGLSLQEEKEIEAQMAKPELYEDTEELQALQYTYGQLLRQLEETEAIWLSAQETFDAAGL